VARPAEALVHGPVTMDHKILPGLRPSCHHHMRPGLDPLSCTR
jgi:hypothetical protein